MYIFFLILFFPLFQHSPLSPKLQFIIFLAQGHSLVSYHRRPKHHRQLKHSLPWLLSNLHRSSHRPFHRPPRHQEMRWGPPRHRFPPNPIILQLGHSPRYSGPVPRPLQRNDWPRRKSSPVRLGLASHRFDESHRAYLVFVLCLIEWRTMEAILVFVLRLIWGCVGVCVWGCWVSVVVVLPGWWW